MSATTLAPLMQPNKAEVSRRNWIKLIAEQYELPHNTVPGTFLSLVATDKPGVTALTGEARQAVQAMFRRYPRAKTRDGLSAVQSAINLARMDMAFRGLEVDTTIEAGKPFGLAMVFFHKAIADAEEKYSKR